MCSDSIGLLLKPQDHDIYTVIFTAGLCSPAANQHACHSGPIFSQIQGIKILPCIHIYTVIYTAGLKLNLNQTLSPHYSLNVHDWTEFPVAQHSWFPAGVRI